MTKSGHIAKIRKVVLGIAFRLMGPAMVFCLTFNVQSLPAVSAADSPADQGGAIQSLDPMLAKSEDAFVEFMLTKQKVHSKYLRLRHQRLQQLLKRRDVYRPKEINAFLLTPREEFTRKLNRGLAYNNAALIIGYGVTLSGPHLVGRMSSALDVQPGEKVLEIGTGSGYHSAFLASLTDKVYTIEIIEPLAAETDKIYQDLVARGYTAYQNIVRKTDDGYYGWEQYAPFDKIIVTCGIDHIPPPLLKQLKVGGTMVIPVGPPTSQTVLKVKKQQDDAGNFTITREDIYQGRKKVTFVPFTKKGGGTHFK
ncbi:MAG: protein-L-isoaspartate O-methyltransferase [Desulfobacterales bacterium]|nr:protein-L-isoaspartate O-methyltransferase [Desulfobacterales bacterium]